MTAISQNPLPVRANYHHLVMDIAWFGIALAATQRFLQFFALKMGATPLELGWITSIPAVVLIVAVSLSQWWRSRYSDSIGAVWLPSIVFRLVFLLPAFAPFFPPEWRMAWIIFAATLPAVGQGIASAVFAIMMREAVPQDQLPPLLTHRHRALNIAITLGAIGFGIMLEYVPFPLNYQLMFVLAFAASMVSQWHIGRIKVQGMLSYPAPPSAPSKPKRSLKALLSEDNFQSVAFVTFVSYVAFHLIFSVIPLHLEQDLNATEGFMGIFGAVEVASAFGITYVLNRLIARLGNRAVVAWALAMNGLAALVIALAPSLEWTLISAALTGASWSAIGVCVFGFFAERTAVDDMQASIVFHQIAFLAIFVGPMLGSIMVNEGMSVVSVLLVGAFVRFLGAWLTHMGLRVFGKRRIEPIYDVQELK
jgi:predicted MFS family arabinose efflux permease